MKKKWVLWAVPFLVIFGMKTHRTYALDGDEPHYLLIAESLLHDHDLSMDNQYPDAHAYLPQQTPWHVIQTPKGRLFPVHDIGMGFLLIPVLILIHWIVPAFPASWLTFLKMGSAYKLTVMLCCMQSMAVTGLLAVLLFHYFLLHAMSERVAFWGALACVLTPPILTHSYLVFTELYSAVILVALLCLWKKREVYRAWPLWYSLAVFVLSWLHIKNLFMTGVLALVPLGIFSRKPQNSWLQRCLPLVFLLAALALRATVHWHYLDSFSLFAMRKAGEKATGLAAVPRCFIYNFLDQEYGLLFTNPLFWLVPVALAVYWKKGKDWFMLEGTLIAAYLANILPTEVYIGGWHPAGRHLLPIVPLIWVPLWSFVYDACQTASTIRWPVRLWLGLTLGLSLFFWNVPKLTWIGNGANRWMPLLPGARFWQPLLPTLSSPPSTLYRCSAFCLAGGLIVNLGLILGVRSMRHAQNLSKTTIH